jgi:hypothetical protein
MVEVVSDIWVLVIQSSCFGSYNRCAPVLAKCYSIGDVNPDSSIVCAWNDFVKGEISACFNIDPQGCSDAIYWYFSGVSSICARSAIAMMFQNNLSQ